VSRCAWLGTGWLRAEEVKQLGARAWQSVALLLQAIDSESALSRNPTETVTEWEIDPGHEQAWWEEVDGGIVHRLMLVSPGAVELKRKA
jgi:hypothetical protein